MTLFQPRAGRSGTLPDVFRQVLRVWASASCSSPSSFHYLGPPIEDRPFSSLRTQLGSCDGEDVVRFTDGHEMTGTLNLVPHRSRRLVGNAFVDG